MRLFNSSSRLVEVTWREAKLGRPLLLFFLTQDSCSPPERPARTHCRPLQMRVFHASCSISAHAGKRVVTRIACVSQPLDLPSTACLAAVAASPNVQYEAHKLLLLFSAR